MATVARQHGFYKIRAASLMRTDAMPRDWADGVYSDYWLYAGSADPVTASGATNLSGLDSFGWTTTSVVFTNTVTADFLSSADDTPPNYNANASGDLIRSPLVLGDYAHANAVSAKLGFTPTRLIVEFYGALSTRTADESATYIGLDNASAVVMAVYSDSANFVLNNGSATEVGAAIDSLYHLFRLELDSTTGLCTWFIDGASQGTLAIIQDVWPAAFAAVASTTNRWNVNFVHVWYEE